MQKIPLKQKMGIPIETADFIIFRPKRSYRTNANIAFLKGEQPIIYDLGTPFNPGAKFIADYLQKRKIDVKLIRYLIISHCHQDHYQDLPSFRRIMPDAAILCHEKDLDAIMHPFRIQSSWIDALKMKGWKTPILISYELFFRAFSPFYFKNVSGVNRIDGIISDGQIIGKDPQVKIIHTPGHSDGHISIIDSKGNLFLGDFVPFTPWINPHAKSIDHMLRSLEKIEYLLKHKAKRVIRAHGDYRFKNWEINEPEFELDKFEFFKDSINHILETLPKFLKTPRRIEQIAQFINPNYDKYSKIMKLFFIPPALTWAMAYCTKLKAMGEIDEKKTAFYSLWSS